MPKGALHGVRIIDFSHFEAGPFATLLLAGLGAEVIKIERPGTGDASRMRRPGGPDADSPLFSTFNAGKRSLTLDLSKPEGIAIAERLIRDADIVVENFSPGAVERLGLGYEAAKALNPRIVYAHICGFAPGTPRAGYPSYDAVAQAVGGSMSVTGEPGGGPLRPGINLGDSGTGMAAALMICAALFQRERTGEGQEIHVPMQDVVLNFSRAPIAAGMQSGNSWPRVGNQVFRHAFKDRVPFPGPSDVFACAGGGDDDYCFVHVLDFTDASYRTLFDVIGRAELIDDPRFSSHAARIENMDALDQVVADWCAALPKWEVMDRLGSAGITAGAVCGTAEILADTALRERGSMTEVADGAGRPFRMPGFPARMRGAAGFGAVPGLGADSESVLGEIGYGPDAIAGLRDGRVI